MHIGIPDLEQYNPQRGIGRTITALLDLWRAWGHQIVPLFTRQIDLPILRNTPLGLQGPAPALDVLLVPDLIKAGLLLTSRDGIPCVTLVYDVGTVDCPADRAQATLLTRPLFRLALWAACRSSRLVAISEFTSLRLEAQAPCTAGRTAVVHLGVDHATFLPGDRDQTRASVRGAGVPLDEEDFFLIYVGAEYARKNLPTLLEALKLLRTSVPRARLLKVGAAHDKRARALTMSAIQRLGLEPGRDVIFVEDVEDAFLAQLYRCADVFVSTSAYEGFGLPLLEALACGLPCVVSRAGALPEVGGEAALYVEPYDAQGLAARLAEVARGEHDSLREQAQARAAQFSWEKTAAATLQVLEEAIAEHRSTGCQHG